jgi:hypothetical protein
MNNASVAGILMVALSRFTGNRSPVLSILIVMASGIGTGCGRIHNILKAAEHVMSELINANHATTYHSALHFPVVPHLNVLIVTIFVVPRD